jgi:hypothetical protein
MEPTTGRAPVSFYRYRNDEVLESGTFPFTRYRYEVRDGTICVSLCPVILPVAHTVPVYAGLIDSSCRDVPSLIDGPAGIAVRRLACIDTTARFWTRRQHSR